MPVYGKVITAAQLGQKLQSVTCEKCKTDFFYKLTRIGVGKGSALYDIGEAGAASRAQSAAITDLDQRLAQEAELVPCPKCHWVNQDLVVRYRKRKYRRAPQLIGVIIVGGLIASLFAWASLDELLGDKSQIPSVAETAIVVAALSSPLYVLLLRYRLRARINPNLTYPRPPRVPPGTPLAWIQKNDPQTEELIFVPVASGDQLEQARDSADGTVFRPAEAAFPPFCCICLADASTVYRPPLMVDERSEFGVPICDSCALILKRRWWKTLLIVTAASFALSAIAAMTLPFGDAGGRWGCSGFSGFFVALIGGVIIAARACRPYRITVIDGDRGLVKFAAINPGYTELLAKHVWTSQGLPAKL